MGAFLLRPELRRLRRAEHRLPSDTLGELWSQTHNPRLPARFTPQPRASASAGRQPRLALLLLSLRRLCPHWDLLWVLSSPWALLWAQLTGDSLRVPSPQGAPLGSVLTMGSPLGSVLTGAPLGPPPSPGTPSGLRPHRELPLGSVLTWLPLLTWCRETGAAVFQCDSALRAAERKPKASGDREAWPLALTGLRRRCTRVPLKAHSLPGRQARRPQGVQACMGRDRTA